jgi:CsoR family transcriptional regulator, copper-sensing transcriptional repressor
MIPELKKDALLRLKVIRGHLEGVQQMVEQDAYCVDVMKQLAAVQSSLEKVNQIVLRNHLLTCMSEAARSGQMAQMVDELLGSLKYNKSLTDGRLWETSADDPTDPSACCAGHSESSTKP